MLTLGLAGRAVATWTDGAEVVELGCKFTNPVVVPADGLGRGRRLRHREEGRGRPGHDRSRGDLRGREGARDAQGCRACLSPPARLLADHTTLRLGGPARDWVRATTEAGADRRGLVRRRERHAGAGARRRLQPGGRRRRASTDSSSRSRPRGVTPDTDDARGRLRRRHGPRRGRRGLGRPRGHRRRAGLGRRRGAVRHPRQRRRHPDPERRRLRPGRGADHRLGPRLGPDACRACAPSPPPTAASATGTRASRPTRRATSCSASTSSSAPGTLGAPIDVRRARPHPRRRDLGSARRLAEVRDAVLGLRTGKGMVLDAGDHDTWSAGSFFTNPHLTPEQAAALPADAPRWPAGRRHGEVERGLADRARRVRQGLRPRPARRPRLAVDQAHAGAHQPGRGQRPRTCSHWRARSATGWSRPSAYASSTSRCSSAAACSGQALRRSGRCRRSSEGSRS